jgi:23S rRNA (adenine2030-N6)-methyltransferase
VNYRHAYHAGNFADVLKHATLALVIEHLKRKEAPFRIIDTHAGAGLYDLSSEQAQKTGEWRAGIGRLLGPDARPVSDARAAHALEPYLNAVKAENPGRRFVRYPGSPRVARRLMRAQDRLVLNELHPEEAARLEQLFARDPQTKVLRLDGWVALKSLLPPKERRGAVLVDPPFEERDELDRLALGLREATRRFATGVFLLWYPIKDVAARQAFEASVRAQQQRMLVAELMIRAPMNAADLNGCGLIIVNPPYTLAEQLDSLLPELAQHLAQSPGGGFRLERVDAARS